jgi:hypothetical protein
MKVLAGRKSALQVHMFACERYRCQLSMLLEFKDKEVGRDFIANVENI